jgi:spore photoproduct lyase
MSSDSVDVTQPLAPEHLTGSWRRAVEHFGAWDAPVQLRWTTKFDDVGSFIGLPHHGRTRVRLSVNCRPVTTRVEGGTSPMEDRLTALRRLAQDGYPVGGHDRADHRGPGLADPLRQLLSDIADAVRDVPQLDLTAELITHRFTPGSKDVLLGWYPHTKLAMDEASRSRKHGKFGAVKYVYPAAMMAELRSLFCDQIAERLPSCRILYWT